MVGGRSVESLDVRIKAWSIAISVCAQDSHRHRLSESRSPTRDVCEEQAYENKVQFEKNKVNEISYIGRNICHLAE